ncbi:hypothetical protein LTR08_002398 [Meristemomyces frigidus]|nr:hypothetical protein LTR08_002398 [Meristemomyces frigidus]
MAGKEYTVASAAQLLGAKPPKRREIDEAYFAKMKAIDRSNRDQSVIKRSPHAKTVRFDRTERDDGGEGSGVNAASSISNFPIVGDPASGTRSNVGDVRQNPVVVEFPARIKELRAEETLPAKHFERIAKTSRIDTSVPNININIPNSASRSISRNPSTSSRTSHRSSQVLFFSPVGDLNRSQISLSDPVEDPLDAAQLTPTQARYDEAILATTGQPKQAPMRGAAPFPDSEKVTLTPEQVDRLVKALAESPFINVHVSKQWWDDVEDDDAATTVSSIEETPSLSSGSAASSSFYSQPNQAFVTEQRSPRTTQAILDEEFARDFSNHPKAKHPAAHAAAAARATKFGGIAVADPKVTGCPIRFLTEGYRLGANVLQVGACSFLNIPYGTTVQSNLRIEPPSSVSRNARVMLQVVNQMLERKTGQKTYLLVAELDVTESFTRAAVMELAAAADLRLSDIQLLTPIEKPHRQSSHVDWCALADELEASCAINDIVELAASSFARLGAGACTMQTLALMSELELLKRQHQDFLVARPTGLHRNGMLSGVQIPWTSQHLDALLYASDPHNVHGEASKAARVLRDRVVSAVAEGCVREKAFDSRVWWGDQMRLVHCVPLMESTGGRPAAWVAFLSGESEHLPFQL